jgi:hypothetical protein
VRCCANETVATRKRHCCDKCVTGTLRAWGSGVLILSYSCQGGVPKPRGERAARCQRRAKRNPRHCSRVVARSCPPRVGRSIRGRAPGCNILNKQDSFISCTRSYLSCGLRQSSPHNIWSCPGILRLCWRKRRPENSNSCSSNTYCRTQSKRADPACHFPLPLQFCTHMSKWCHRR